MKTRTLVASLAVAALAACGSEPTAARAPEGPRLDLTPLSASISGPSQVQLGYTCTWTAVVSGGTPPYRYFWSAWYGQLGRNSTFTSAVNEIGAKTLYLTVWDAFDEEVIVTKGVSGTTSPVGCPSS